MEIKKVISDKKEFLDLLLLADEQEDMIDRYLERGDMFVLYDDGLKALCVVTREGEGVYEIKNIATVPFFQRQGYGKRLIEFLFEYYQGKCSEMLVGTGDVPSSRSFYEHCGFAISHRIKNFFTDNYDHPMYEDGLKALCVVTREGEGVYEIKNIATVPFFQRQGYGKRLIEFLFEYYQGKCSEMLVGTGDVPSSRSFYEHCGFAISHRIKNFFTDNYDHPMYEDGVQLVDMIYLKKTF